MRQSGANAVSRNGAHHADAALIGAGLAILLARAAWPGLPAASAFALIAWGATIATASRWANCAVLTAHLLVYSCLYLLVVGGICSAAASGAAAGPSVVQLADLGLSAAIFVFVWRTCTVAIVADRN